MPPTASAVGCPAGKTTASIFPDAAPESPEAKQVVRFDEAAFSREVDMAFTSFLFVIPKLHVVTSQPSFTAWSMARCAVSGVAM